MKESGSNGAASSAAASPAPGPAFPIGRSPPAAGPALPIGVSTDRGTVFAPLVVDALGWRRGLARSGSQPPAAPLSRAREGPPAASDGVDLDVWIERSLVRRGYLWRVPAGGEQRVGAGSYEPGHPLKRPTQDLAARLDYPTVRYQGNWFPHRLRDAAEDGIFFV